MVSRFASVVDVFLSCTRRVHYGHSVFIIGGKASVPVHLSVGGLGDPDEGLLLEPSLVSILEVEAVLRVDFPPLCVHLARVHHSQLLSEDGPHPFVAEVPILLLVLLPVFPSGNLHEPIVTRSERVVRVVSYWCVQQTD